MKLGVFFKAALASATIAGAGAAGGFAGYQAAPLLQNLVTPAPVTDTVVQPDTAELYHTRIDELAEAQNDLDNTTDQEDAVAGFSEEKKDLAAALVLDRNISDADFVSVAVRFNGLSGIDGIRLRAINFDPRTVIYRGDCLASTPATDAQWGNDRYAYTQRVESCMIEKWENGDDVTPPATTETASADTSVQRLAAAGGALGGGLLAFGFSLGYAVRGNRRLPAAKPG